MAVPAMAGQAGDAVTHSAKDGAAFLLDDAEDSPNFLEQPHRLRRRLFRSGPGSGVGPRRLRRIGLALVTFVLTVCLVAACAIGALLLRLSHGPMPVNLEAQVAEALSARVKHGFVFTVGGTDLRSIDGHPALVVRQLLVRDESGRSVIQAPSATISIDPLKLLAGAIVPTRLDVQDVILTLSILPDGDVALSAGSETTLPFRLSDAIDTAAPGPSRAASVDGEAPGSPQPQSPAREPTDPLARLAAALAPLIDTLTGADDALGGFDRLGVTHAILVLDDRSHNAVKSYRNLEFEFEKTAEGAAAVSLGADGVAGRWAVSLRGLRGPDSRRSLSLDMQNLTLDDVRMVPGLRDPGFDSDAPVAFRCDLGLDPNGSLAVARGQISVGSGYFRLNDPDHEPVMLDRIDAPFHLDPTSRRLVFDPATIQAGTTSYQFDGAVAVPATALAEWPVTAKAKGVFGAERPNEKAIAFDRIEVAARINAAEHALSIDRLAVAGPQVDLALKADVRGGDTGLTIKASATAGRMPAPVIVRLWPSLLSAQVRAWLIANLQAGTVEHGSVSVTLDEADLALIKAQHSVADGHLQMDYAVSDVTLAFMTGVPPLRGVIGTGTVTGDTSRFNVSRGWMEVAPGRQLALADGSLVVPSTDPKPTPAVITAHVVGGIDALSELLARDALKTYAGLPPEAADAKGQIDGVLTVGLDLGAQAKPDTLKLGANAKINGLEIDRIIGKQNLTQGQITLLLDKTGLKAKGDALIFGAPTTIDIRKPAGTGPGEANIQITLDDAARAKAGMNFGKSVTGPVTAKIVTGLGGVDKKAAIDVDLTHVTLNDPVPGLSKAAGKPGRLTLTASQRDNGVDLDAIVCDIGAFSVRGSADLDGSGNFQSARLGQVHLSPGDDMKIDVTQAGDGLKIVARGANLDARPFLKSLSSADGPDPAAKDIDIDLHSNLLTGQNSQVLTGVDLKLVRKGGMIRKLQLAGKFGRAPVTATSTPQGNVLVVTVSSADAGASLAFLDLYKRVSGGQLDTTIRMLDGRMDGNATIHEFGLREDPAMKKLAEESLSQSKNGNARIDASNLSFTKLLMTFSKSGSKVEVKDGAIFGPQMGATVQGWIDFSRDKVALSGTFVPIYGVNNLFSQLPLVGPILGGGAHEGLFGLNYKISGSVATPNLSIDPFSALAPGFLRKIFGAISEATEDDGAPTPKSAATPLVQPAR